MATIRVIVAASIDGYLPAKEDERLEWLRTDRRGFKRWHESSDRELYAGYPLIDLICEKEEKNNGMTYLAEVSDKESAELLRGLFLYHIVDEMILYLLPTTLHEGIRVLDNFTPATWKTVQVRHYGNGICRMVYRKATQ